MASYGATTLEENGTRSRSALPREDSEVSVMLANALRKMDGLIGDYRLVLDPLLATNPCMTYTPCIPAEPVLCLPTTFICGAAIHTRY